MAEITSANNDYKRGEFTAADGYRLAYRRYLVPEGVPAMPVILCCIHGIQSHAGWYEGSCRHFANAGIETWFIDRRGSGFNAVDRGHCKSWRQLVDDLLHSMDEIRRQRPQSRVALLAISWGGKLAMAAQKIRPGFADALIFVAPGWSAKVGPSLRDKLAIGWSALCWPRRMFKVPLNDPALFTADPKWQNYLRNDELSLRRATARLFLSSKLLDGFIANAAETVNLPTLLQLAGRDRIVENADLRQYFERFPTTSKRLIEYPNAEHTLEFEPNAKAIAQDAADFLLASFHCPKSDDRIG